MGSGQENDIGAAATTAQPGGGASSVADVLAIAARLRARRDALSGRAERAEAALARVWEVWRERLATGWEPPATDTAGAFPWAQVRVSLAGLVSSWEELRGPLTPDKGGTLEEEGIPASVDSSVPPLLGVRGLSSNREVALAALVLAGNTPLLAWPALCAALLAGKAVFVKMSRSETVWAGLFWETLRDADADVAGLVHLDVWPGDDARTATLMGVSDAVIAYGGDGALAALRSTAAAGNADAPFWGFGHAVSVGIVCGDADLDEAARGFARDVLMFDQGGCLSPQVIFVEESGNDGVSGRAGEFAERLARAFPPAAAALEVAPSGDAGRARAVRQARQMALFTPGARVLGDADLRWTVIAHRDAQPAGEPTGFGVVSVLPVGRAEADLGEALGALRGFLSSAGVAGTVTDTLRTVLEAEGATRICEPGRMQAPPLDWRNGGVDLWSVLRRG